MYPRFASALASALWGLVATLSVGAPALADEDRGAAAGPVLPKYQQECASCHVAYPARLLPAASWQRLMANLPRHFGTDASLDPATLKELSNWLAANAGTGRRVSQPPPEDRITRLAWFIREHGKVPDASWKLPAVKSPANCGACHTQAEKGDFNEHNIRIPR